MKSLLIAAAFVLASATGATAQMSHDTHGDTHGSTHDAAQSAASIPGEGTVNAVDVDKGTVNITHEPIAAIGWPSMTMDFAVAEGIDLAALAAGAPVAFTLARGSDGIYMIDSLQTR